MSRKQIDFFIGLHLLSAARCDRAEEAARKGRHLVPEAIMTQSGYVSGEPYFTNLSALKTMPEELPNVNTSRPRAQQLLPS